MFTAPFFMDLRVTNYPVNSPCVIYHPGMNRSVMVLWVALTLMLTGIASPTGAAAEPPPPGTLCSFTLSPPHVVQASGGDMVTATVTPTSCVGPFRPLLSVVCVQRAGSSTQCTQARDTDTAQLFVAYDPGATYTSTGRGLGTVFNDASEPNWQLLGPFTAAL